MDKNTDSDSPRKLRLERERKQRREDIIKTAKWFFTNNGYDQTMIDQIALKAGYSKATIYNYFDSKDDLFIAVVSKAFEKLFLIMEKILNAQDEKFDLLTLGKAYLEFIEEHFDYAGLFRSGRLNLVMGKMIIKEQANQVLTESEKEFRDHQQKVEKLMLEVITETMNISRVKSDLDPFSVVMALSTLGTAINELVMRGKRDKSNDRSQEYIEVLFNIIDKGLKHYDD